MKVLFLGPENSAVAKFMRSLGHKVDTNIDPLNAVDVKEKGYDLLISFGYRHILKGPILDLFQGRAINLHISYLPWNRGADPNLWSFVDDTLKGVTIHFIDEGIDTGDIIVQREVPMEDTETLRTSYEKLQRAIEFLFFEFWDLISSGDCKGKRQPPGGSLHRMKDKERLLHLLTDGWDTPVAKITGQEHRQGFGE